MGAHLWFFQQERDFARGGSLSNFRNRWLETTPGEEHRVALGEELLGDGGLPEGARGSLRKGGGRW